MGAIGDYGFGNLIAPRDTVLVKRGLIESYSKEVRESKATIEELEKELAQTRDQRCEAERKHAVDAKQIAWMAGRELRHSSVRLNDLST